MVEFVHYIDLFILLVLRFFLRLQGLQKRESKQNYLDRSLKFINILEKRNHANCINCAHLSPFLLYPSSRP